MRATPNAASSTQARTCKWPDRCCSASRRRWPRLSAYRSPGSTASRSRTEGFPPYRSSSWRSAAPRVLMNLPSDDPDTGRALDETTVKDLLRGWAVRAAGQSGVLLWLGHGASDGDDAWL